MKFGLWKSERSRYVWACVQRRNFLKNVALGHVFPSRVFQRDPNPGDSRGPEGKLWLNRAANYEQGMLGYRPRSIREFGKVEGFVPSSECVSVSFLSMWLIVIGVMNGVYAVMVPWLCAFCRNKHFHIRASAPSRPGERETRITVTFHYTYNIHLKRQDAK